jgi:hypothetical protein
MPPRVGRAPFCGLFSDMMAVFCSIVIASVEEGLRSSWALVEGLEGLVTGRSRVHVW